MKKTLTYPILDDSLGDFTYNNLNNDEEIEKIIRVRRQKLQTYENLFIIRPEIGEDKINEKITEVEELIKSNNGIILKIDNWGKKRLAYRISKVRNGIYILITFKMEPKFISKIERGLKLKENIIKYSIIKIDETKTPVEETQESVEEKQEPVERSQESVEETQEKVESSQE